MAGLIKQHQARLHQRTRQQGKGRPIISAEANGTRFVAVGNRMFQGSWATFHDFLLHYLKSSFGSEWGLREISKPYENQHPLVQCLYVLSDLIKNHPKHEEVSSIPGYGSVNAVYGLAYDLYLVEHHLANEGDRQTFDRILDRLRNAEQFFGARHELRAAKMLLLAGFHLAWEDDQGRHSKGHGEFIATFPQSGRAFWVECKMRQSDREDGFAKFTHLVSSALHKETDLERLIFIELNLADEQPILDEVNGGWPAWAVNQLRTLEAQPTAATLPSALILISNFPEYRYLTTTAPGSGALLEGFKTEKYRTGEVVPLMDAIRNREENVEIENLWRSMQEHKNIPVSFDGSIYGINESQRLIIGRPYQLSSGKVGFLETAIVMESERHATGIFRMEDGSRVIERCPLSDVEMNAWRQHPDTFFGELRPHHPPTNDPVELYEITLGTYSKTPKDKLLEFMTGAPDIDQLRQISQPELAKRYAYGMATSIALRSKPTSPPSWYQRLKKIKNK